MQKMRFAFVGLACAALCACTLIGRDLRPRLTAQEYADARSRFIAALRSRAGEGAVDCGIELEDVLRRGDDSVSSVAVCVRSAWERQKPFYTFEEQRIYCPQFSGYVGDGSGKVWVMSICPDMNRDMHEPQVIHEVFCDAYAPPTTKMYESSCSELDWI